jgi:hypothetical protein
LKPVLILKKTHHKKRAGGVAQGVGPKFKPQYCKKKKTERGRLGIRQIWVFMSWL